MAAGWQVLHPGRLRRAIYRFINRFELDETTTMVIMAGVVGIIGGFGAILFRWMVQFFQIFAIGRGEDTVELLANLTWWHKILLPAAAALVVGPMVHFLAREAKGHGVPEVINAVVFQNGIIRPIVAAVKITASAITIAFGGSVGREGPIIQIGASMGSTLGQWLHFSPQRLKTLIGCGAAAGIAATFNAPIAGAFFALEIILRDFAVLTFSPIIVASVLGTAVSHHFLGDTPAFPVPGFRIHSWVELLFYLPLGLLTAVLAVGYVRGLYATEGFFDRLRFPEWLKPLLGAIPLGILFIWFPQVYGIGYSFMVRALEGSILWYLMALLIVVKLIAVSLTLGSGFSGGIFAPALFLGGMLGGAYGALVGQLVHGDVAAVGAFAMVGMAAMVAASTGGPLTAILILFEMTGEYRIILPLMLSCITAALFYRRLMDDTIFTLKFTRQGTDLVYGGESAILRSYHVHDIMEVNPPTLSLSHTFDRILKLFLGRPNDLYYVVRPDRTLVGRISIHDVKDLLHAESLRQVVIAADLCQPAGQVVHQHDNLEDCLLHFGQTDHTQLPVLDSAAHPVLVGVVTRSAVFEVYNREVLHKKDLGIKLVHGPSRLRDCVDLPESFRVQVLTPPDSYIGHNLRELQLRQRFHISVLAVKKRELLGEARNELPDPDRPLAESDRLIVVGHVEDLTRLLAEVQQDGFVLPLPTS
jgi:CIC family chloride channel protein